MHKDQALISQNMIQRNSKYLLFFFMITFGITQHLFSQDNEILAINKVIGEMDDEKLSTYFQETISLSVQNLQGKYSKTQARYILADFFKKNPNGLVTEESKSKISDDSSYCILKYECADKRFNIYYRIQLKKDSYLISEIKIKEKSK